MKKLLSLNTQVLKCDTAKGLKSSNDNLRLLKGKGKGKVIPLQARCGPEGG